MSDSSDEDAADLPSAAECDRRCKEFAAVTGTDSALAMFFLQDRHWSLQVGVAFICPCSLFVWLSVTTRLI